ncbi:hypothetical protein GCM10009743_68560 [Kribbella swartbergensis]
MNRLKPMCLVTHAFHADRNDAESDRLDAGMPVRSSHTVGARISGDELRTRWFVMVRAALVLWSLHLFGRRRIRVSCNYRCNYDYGLTTSMRWAQVALAIYAERRLFPCLQGVLAVLVDAGWTHFKTVVTGGSLPKSSHGGRRSGGLSTPRFPLHVVARAMVWMGV